MASLSPLVEQLSIVTKEAVVTRLKPNWAQKELLGVAESQMNDGRPVRIIVLKARQLGISTITEALMFWSCFLWDRWRGMVIAHENDLSEHLLGMTSLYWDTFPYRSLYTSKYLSRKEMVWKENGSGLRIATAGNVKSGRGRTLSGLHASEVGFWEHPDTLMLGMRQAIPNHSGTMIVLESTANGIGNYFHDTWVAAVDNEVDYFPLFCPWWREPDYCASAIGIEMRPMEMDSEERVLSKIGVTKDALLWRRWAVKNLCGGNEEKFHQEYPSTADEAFVQSGSNVYPIDRLRDVYEPVEGQRGRLFRDGAAVRFEPDFLGPLTIYKKPSVDKDFGRYFVAGDPTHATFGDFACGQVINRRTYEQVAVWHGRVDPMTFAEELAKVGKFYNDAMLTVEVEGPGYAAIGRLIELDYPHLWQGRWADKSPGKISESFGWSTTWKRKEWAVGWLLKLVIDRDITIHDARTFKEMTNFVTLPGAGYANVEGEGKGHDDTVMALAIACVCSSTDGPMPAYSGRGERKEIPAWSEWKEAMEDIT